MELGIRLDLNFLSAKPFVPNLAPFSHLCFWSDSYYLYELFNLKIILKSSQVTEYIFYTQHIFVMKRSLILTYFIFYKLYSLPNHIPLLTNQVHGNCIPIQIQLIIRSPEIRNNNPPVIKSNFIIYCIIRCETWANTLERLVQHLKNPYCQTLRK